ncbi:MAG: hypothetical protein Q7R41_12695, partial [Phycisphaerales bacterium]|nr:hypothetical protein [Phycisphaerales bacterium]
FGKGLRFFLDPLGGGTAPVGEMVSAIPDSMAFRVEFEGWMSQRYQDPEALFTAWGMNRRDAGTFEQAARLTPLWWDGRGVSFAADRATDRYIDVETPRSAMWRDILEFRDSSIRDYMNTIADTIRRCAIDAPVVFPADTYNRIYVNNSDSGGFSGLAAAISSESDADTTIAGEASALTLDSPRTSWFVGLASAGQDAGGPSRALARLKDLGAKGFFASVPTSGEGPGLDAVAQFKTRLDSASAEYVPEIIYYPYDIGGGARVRKLDFKTWWLPTMRAGELVQFGENVFGYTIAGHVREPAESLPALSGPGKPAQASVPSNAVCLWSNTGPTTVTVKLREQSVFSVSAASADAAQLSAKRDLLTLKLSDTPIVIYGLTPDQLFPMEVAQSEISMLEKSIAAAAKA